MGIYVQQSETKITVNLAKDLGSAYNGIAGNFDIELDVQFNNNFVNVHFPAFVHLTGEGSNPIIFRLPGDLQPKNLESFIVTVINNNIVVEGRLVIDTDGLVTITVFPDTEFTSQTQGGISFFSINYVTKVTRDISP